MSVPHDRFALPLTSLVPPSTRPARRRKGADRAAQPALPPKPDELSWHDYLIALLHIAAELEHALMVQYLYAAYSLGGPGAEEHADQVHEWRDVILTVAREEMGHLLTVQNALLLIGGPISFDRSDFPWSSPFYPFPFRLEPLSLDSLARYVYAEMPQDLTRPADIAVRDAVLGIVKPGRAPTVGEIYDRIIRLVGDRELIPDATFDAGSYPYQATWDEWGRGYRPGTHRPYAKHPDVPPPYERKTRVIVAQMATRTEALAGLRDVAGQGEAEHVRATDKHEESHFDRFARIFRAYQRILERKPGWSPSRPVPANPFAGVARSAPPHTTPIVAQGSAAWAGLFNVRYRMLLTLLTYSFGVSRGGGTAGGSRRAALLGRIFGEMYNLKAIAGILVRLPLGDPAQPERAGPPFQVPYSFVLPAPDASFWRLQLDLLDASSGLMEGLLDPARGLLAQGPADGARYLRALRAADRDARRAIEGFLGGVHASRRARA